MERKKFQAGKTDTFHFSGACLEGRICLLNFFIKEKIFPAIVKGESLKEPYTFQLSGHLPEKVWDGKNTCDYDEQVPSILSSNNSSCDDEEAEDNGNAKRPKKVGRHSRKFKGIRISPSPQVLGLLSYMLSSQVGNNIDPNMENVTKLAKSILQDEEHTTETGSSSLVLNAQIYDEPPKGFIVLYVGKSRRRYFMSAHYLNHPLLRVLSQRCEEDKEEGFTVEHCEVVMVEHL
ncbi:hypothetical protein KI387_035462, partial [Taxus chinensis]